jgi:isoleucyl-tRNA synthetase
MKDQLKPFLDILREELNVKTVKLKRLRDDSATKYGIIRTLTVNARAAGPRLGREVQRVIGAAKTGDWSETDGVVTAGGVALETGEYELTLNVGDGGSGADALALLPDGGFVLLSTETTPELEAEGIARDAIRAVQEARKKARLDVSDRIGLSMRARTEDAAALNAHAELIASETLASTILIRGAAAHEISAEIDDIASGLASDDGIIHLNSAAVLGAEKTALIIRIETNALNTQKRRDK